MTVTRFAPSPTGYLHVGNLRTALFNFMISQKTGGKFILRLDDTDQERSKPEYADGIQRDLEWLGIEWDRIERQSARLDRYTDVAQHLRDIGRFYECFESPVELDLKRKKQLNMGKPPVYDRAALALSDAEKDKLRSERGGYWRFKLDQERIEWNDQILGDISIDAASVSDPVLIRADGQFLYTLASVVDDTDMGVTHIVRGSDHVTNTATQIQIIEALGFKAPTFGHHSLLTGPQGEALSKRLGTLALRDLREQGVEPMALLSHMARLGANEPFVLRANMAELIENFDLSQFGAAPTKFDVADLFPITGHHLAAQEYTTMADSIAAVGVPADQGAAFWDAIHENITTRHDLATWWAMCRDGAEPVIADEDRAFITDAMAILPDTRTETTWGEWTGAVKAASGRKGKGLFQPLRLALTGQDAGPSMAKILPLLQVIKAKG